MSRLKIVEKVARLATLKMPSALIDGRLDRIDAAAENAFGLAAGDQPAERVDDRDVRSCRWSGRAMWTPSMMFSFADQAHELGVRGVSSQR
jgi:hypothetical protein